MTIRKKKPGNVDYDTYLGIHPFEGFLQLALLVACVDSRSLVLPSHNPRLNELAMMEQCNILNHFLPYFHSTVREFDTVRPSYSTVVGLIRIPKMLMKIVI